MGKYLDSVEYALTDCFIVGRDKCMQNPVVAIPLPPELLLLLILLRIYCSAYLIQSYSDEALGLQDESTAWWIFKKIDVSA